MADLEVQPVTPEEMAKRLADSLERRRENKYAFQVRVKDVDFDVDEEKAAHLGIPFPFPSIEHAEQALRNSVIVPTEFIEDDDTKHQVAFFRPEPVGYSGFGECVTHSLALTSEGLFEVGRFSAVNLTSPTRDWQWFVHRRLATSEQVATWQEDNELSPQQVVDLAFETMTGRPGQPESK